MSLLWAIPPVAVVAIGVLVLMALRNITSATEDLNLQLRRLDEVRVAVATVRQESARTRAALQSLQSR